MKYFLSLSQYKNKVRESGRSNSLISMVGKHAMNPQWKSSIAPLPTHWMEPTAALYVAVKTEISMPQPENTTLTNDSESYRLKSIDISQPLTFIAHVMQLAACRTNLLLYP